MKHCLKDLVVHNKVGRTASQIQAVVVRNSLLAVVSIAMMGLAGCTATYIVTHSTAPDGKYAAYANIRGAIGRPFNAESEKLLRVGVSNNDPNRPPVEFHKTFRVLGSDVTWDGVWDSQDNLEMVFYDYAPHISNSILKKSGVPKRYLCTIKFNSTNEVFTQHFDR